MSETKTVAPTRAQFKPLNKVENLSELFSHPEFAKRLNDAIPQHFNGERLLRTMVTAAQKTPKLAKVNPMSMLGACITIAALGLEPNTPLQYAHLIPFEKRKKVGGQWVTERVDVQLIIGYQGYLDLIERSDKLDSFHVDVVYEGDEFSYEYGSNQHLKHIHKSQHRGDPKVLPTHAYFWCKMKSGGERFTVMTQAELLQRRLRSQGYQTALKAYDEDKRNNRDPEKNKTYSEAPWVRDFAAMSMKTAVREAQKWVPKSVELAAAMMIDERSVNYSKVDSGAMVIDGAFEEAEDEEQGAPEPAEQRTEAPAPAAKPKATKTPEPVQQAPETQDEATYTLYNVFGEPETEQPLTGTQFKEQFHRLYGESDDAACATLREYNADALAALGIKCAEEPEPQSDEDRLYISNHKTSAGQPDFVRWVKDAKAVIATLDSVSDLRNFEAVNAASIKVLPAAAGKSYKTAFDKRLNDLAPPVEDEIPPFDGEDTSGNMSQDTASNDVEKMNGQPEDQWTKDAAYLRQMMASAKSIDELRVNMKSEAIRRKLDAIKSNRPDLMASLEGAYEARLVELKA